MLTLRIAGRCGASFVTGDMANFSGLLLPATRFEKGGWDLSKGRDVGAMKSRRGRCEAHATSSKTLGRLGLGRKRLFVPVTRRKNASASLRIFPADNHLLQAGMNTGAFDRRRKLGAARQAGAGACRRRVGLWARHPSKSYLTKVLRMPTLGDGRLNGSMCRMTAAWFCRSTQLYARHE